jgi:hypothetical protein
MKNLQELAIEHNLSGDELILCSNYLVAIRLTQAKIEPNKILKVINDWDRISKSIRILNYNFNN